MSTISSRPPRLEHARDVAQGALGLGQVVQHERQRRGIETRVVDGQCFELAASQLDIVERVQALLCRLQHRGGRIHGQHALDERRKRGRHLPGSAAEIADRPFRIGKRRQGRKMKPLAEQLVAQTIPLPRGRREEFLRLRAPLGQHGLNPALILRCRRRGPDLLANERPEPPGGRVEIIARHCVKVAGAFGARRDPSGIGECLQVAADRRLRKLHDAAQFRHGELVPIEQQQNPAARGVGQGGQVVENGGAASIR